MTIIDAVEAAGLTGRGGGAFSTAVKLRAAQASRARLVVNACDGEVGASKDAWVIVRHLDELTDGARLANGGRRDGVVYAAHRDSATARRLTRAGLDVLDVPHRYVSSEESALISLLHGGQAKPMTKRAPFVYGGKDSQGRRIKPTLVLNAETVWRIHQIDRYGVDWFRSFGTETDPGPRLIAVGGAVARPAVIEAWAGVVLGDLLAAAGDVRHGVEYVVIGGLGGVLVRLDQGRRTVWNREAMAALGGSMGPGVILAVDPDRCPLEYVGELIGYAAGETAGQCGPCMFGLPALATAWRNLSRSPSPSTLQTLHQRVGLVQGRGACHHPDGVARFATSALRALMPHLDEHAAGRCPRARRSHVTIR